MPEPVNDASVELSKVDLSNGIIAEVTVSTASAIVTHPDDPYRILVAMSEKHPNPVIPSGKIEVDEDVTITIAVPNATNNFSQKINLNLFPNPTQNEIHIEIEDAELSNYYIFNANGKLVDFGNLNQQMTILTNHLSNGMYHFVGTNLEGDRVVKKFLVAR